MTATQTPSTVATMPDALRAAMRAAHLVPLWESPTAHQTDPAREQPHLWPWRELGPIVAAVSEISSPALVERRVLSLVNPKATTPEDEATCGVISTTIQTLLPGETARPHRHSMNALRFVVQGSGAETVVDGKRCPMNPGDLIITPAWCWHQHVSEGDEPTVWFDVLDVALHLAIGTDEFQPGPIVDQPEHPDDAAYTVANIVAEVDTAPTRRHSPVFRYPYEEAVRALRAAPAGPDGSRRIRYVNPLTGGPAMELLDCSMTELDTRPTRARTTNASTVCVVVEGAGRSVIGGRTVDWQAHDVFTVPQNATAVHEAVGGPARVFMVTNREVYERLGLLRDSDGTPA